LGFVWALPVTLPAALVALLTRAAGGTLAWRAGALEASGGFLPFVLGRCYPPMSIAAITLGHVVLAQRQDDLDRTRAHERVHVRQYERWGSLFPFLYLLASAAALMRGGDPYRDNPFEREAFERREGGKAEGREV
jgi:hypothetical protein